MPFTQRSELSSSMNRTLRSRLQWLCLLTISAKHLPCRFMHNDKKGNTCRPKYCTSAASPTVLRLFLQTDPRHPPPIWNWAQCPTFHLWCGSTALLVGFWWGPWGMYPFLVRLSANFHPGRTQCHVNRPKCIEIWVALMNFFMNELSEKNVKKNVALDQTTSGAIRSASCGALDCTFPAPYPLIPP